jgi:hypothetical protein
MLSIGVDETPIAKALRDDNSHEEAINESARIRQRVCHRPEA